MSRRKDLVLLAAGILVGTALAGPLAQATETLTATPSTQRFYVDGEQVELEAYAIQGHNYVQLRDIGRALDFAVTYDAASRPIRMSSLACMTGNFITPSVRPW